MNKMYMIRWRSKTNGRVGTGSRLFEKQEASDLAAELNADYPEIEHEVAEAGTATPAPSGGMKTEEDRERPKQQALSA